MAQQHIRFEQFFAVPRPTVFGHFADHECFGRLWWPAHCRLLRETSGPYAGDVGSMRELRIFGVRFEETITGFKPDECIEYRVTRGGPFKNHVGQMLFTDVPGGTQLDYTIEFDSRWPLLGNFVAGVLHAAWLRGVNRAVDQLMNAAS